MQRAGGARRFGKKQTTSKEHKAAVELASQRRQLAKVLKREGANVSAVFEQQVKRQKPSKQEEEEKQQQQEEEKKQEEEAAAAALPVRSLEDKKAKLKLRQKRSQLLSKKTKRGQPIMRNVIGDLVSRLQQQ